MIFLNKVTYLVCKHLFNQNQTNKCMKTKASFFLWVLALLLCSSQLANEDFYHVLEVNGKIKNIKTNSDLEQGDNLSSTAKVKFNTTDAMAMLHSRTQGRFQLRAKEQQAKPGIELWVRDGLLALSNTTNTRAGKITDLNALRLHFKNEGQPYLILGGKTEIEMSEELIKKFGEGFFFIRYEYQGKNINKQLPIKGNVVTIAEDDIFKIDGKPVKDIENIKNFMISFYRTAQKDAFYIEDTELKKHLYFDLKFVSNETLQKKGVYTLAKYLAQEGESQEKILIALKDLLGDLGGVEKDNLETWYKNNF